MNKNFTRYKSQGDLGEEMGYWFIKFYIHGAKHLTQSDFVLNNSTLFESKLLFKNSNEWSLVEIKHKDPLVCNDFIGTGLNKHQLDARIQFYKDTNIDCLFIVFEKTGKNIYFQYLSKLENHKEFTKTGIIVYNYKHFNNILKQDLFDKLKLYVNSQRSCNKRLSISDDLFKLIGVESNIEYNTIKSKAESTMKKKLLIKYKTL